MSWEYLRRRADKIPAGPPEERTVRRQLAWAAGADFFQNRDPLYHVTENFQMTFDAMGRRHAQQMGGDGGQGEEEQALREGRPGEGRQPQTDSTRSFYERPGPEEQDMLHRFSETAFQRGTLSGAVLQGSGTMMLFSCLKKTIGQSQPGKWQQRKLFERASFQRNLPGHVPDKVQVNRGFSDSAVALTVDVLRDARRVVESLQDIAKGRSITGMGDGAQTLQKMYPFLDDSKERGLLEQYESQLKDIPEGDSRRAVLQNAVARTRALIGKKAQMRLEFMNKLRFLSDRAAEALEVFEQPGFSEALDTALRRALGAEEPPEDGDGDGQADGAADGPPSEGGADVAPEPSDP